MRRRITTILAIAAGLIAGGAVAVLAASQSTGTNVACATATIPPVSERKENEGVIEGEGFS